MMAYIKMDELQIAWIGGSFSPPTNSHIKMALTVARFLSKDGKPSFIYIVPVSHKYPKKSIECATLEQRISIANAFIEAIEDSAREEGLTNVFFKFMDYEMTNSRNRGIGTANSLNILKGQLNSVLPEEYRENPRKIYIVLGQDNLTSFSKGTWKRTENLKKYPFIILKRGNNNSLAINEGKNVVLRTDFSNDASSSVVRKLFQEGNIEEARRHVHPNVFEALENNNPYTNPECDKKGGYRRYTRKVHKKLN